MNPQQKEFDTALAGLTPEQRAAYTKANPTVGVGGVQQSVNNGVYQPIPKTITTGDINSSPSLTPAPPKAPIPTYNPVVTAPTGATLGTDGTATYTPPTTSQPTQASKEESLYQKTLKAIGVDISQLETQPEVTKQLQEAQQLAQKTEQAIKDYNTYNLRRREVETKLREMEATNPEGQFAGARQATIEDYRRKANSELADLAIQAQASQGLLDAARQTIKDTLEAQFSPIEDRIARRTQYAQLAANDLTESEKYQLDQLNKKDEANQKEVSTYAANLANTVFEKGAPVGVRTKIFNIAGDYASGKITKEQALVKMSEAAGNYGVKPSTVKTDGVLGTLPTSVQTKIISKADSIGSSDIGKRYNATVDSINIINGIDTTSKNPADHQTIIYAFAKSLDPESVVREGEYATIKRYAQSLIDRYGKEVTNAIAGTGFLSQKAIDDIKSTMNNNYNSRKPQYDNLVKDTKRIINNIAGKDVAGEIMVDYSAGVTSTQTKQPAIDRGNIEINGLQVTLPSGEIWNAPTLDALNKFKIKYGL